MRRVAPAIAARIHALLASGTPQTVIQETLGVGRSTVLRAKTGISRAKKGPGGRVRKPGPPPAFSAQQLRRPAAALARLRKRLGTKCEITADDISREVAAQTGAVGCQRTSRLRRRPAADVVGGDLALGMSNGGLLNVGSLNVEKPPWKIACKVPRLLLLCV